MRATVVSFMPVAHGRSESATTSAVAEGGEANILWLVMTVPKMQQAREVGRRNSLESVKLKVRLKRNAYFYYIDLRFDYEIEKLFTRGFDGDTRTRPRGAVVSPSRSREHASANARTLCTFAPDNPPTTPRTLRL